MFRVELDVVLHEGRDVEVRVVVPVPVLQPHVDAGVGLHGSLQILRQQLLFQEAVRGALVHEDLRLGALVPLRQLRGVVLLPRLKIRAFVRLTIREHFVSERCATLVSGL